MMLVFNALKEYCIPLFREYEEGDAIISFGELISAVVRAISNCTISECPQAHLRGDIPMLFFEFTLMSSHAKSSFVTSKSLVIAVIKSGEQLYLSFKFTLMLSWP